jgi:sec-independent protein translocase protein TatA
MGLDNPIHIAFLVVILLLVFGAKRLPEMGRSLGSGMRGFKDSLDGGTAAVATSTATATATPASTATPAPAAVAARATHEPVAVVADAPAAATPTQ